MKRKRRNGKYGEAAWMRKILAKRTFKKPRKGEKNGNAKLTNAAIHRIRSFKTMPRDVAEMLAEQFDISPRHVYGIRQRATWKHL